MSTIGPLTIVPSHVAVLLPDVESAASKLKGMGFSIGPAETFEGEGTKEIYVQYGMSNSLLLMEAVGPGSYQRAMEKRGAGLHHLAIDVSSLDLFVKRISGSGWLLHPASLAYATKHKTIYLARPGFPGLIEVHEKSKLISGKLFVEKIKLPIADERLKLLKVLELDHIVANGSEVVFTLSGGDVKLSSLI